MAKERNEQIGTVPCPFPGCAVKCRLFKYRPRDDGRRSAFTGKWYGECADHGRIDGASGKATQDYLIDKGEVWGARKPESGKPENPEKPGSNPESKPAPMVPAPAPKEPEKPEPKPEQKPAPASKPAPQHQTPARAGWGFF